MHSILQVIVKSFKALYEYIGMVMITNLIWFLVGFSPLLILMLLNVDYVFAYLLGVLLTPLFLGPATASAHYVMVRLMDREETRVSDFKVGFRKFFTKGMGLVYLNGILVFILVVDLIFSVNSTNTFFRLLTGLWVWFILFWMVIMQYVFPLLVQHNLGVLATMKRAALLAMDNVGLSLALTLVNGLLLGLSVVLAAPFLLFFVGITGFMQNFALREILKKYEDQKKED